MAKKALGDLLLESRFTDKKQNGHAPTPTAQEMLQKLVELIDRQSLFSNYVESEFLSRFGYKLENNWLDLTENSKVFDVQK